MSRENFLDCRFPIFSARVSDAAANGTFMNAGPLLNNLERTYAVVRGLEQIFVIARANMVIESTSRSSEEDETTEPPLNPVTVEALVAMGAAVSGLLVRDIEDLSDWAEKHAVQPAPTNPAA
ncbi:hypothetical protein LRP76_01405 [Burkholderia pseudomallei]|uniref:hypothetical protein n=1 Tax=Burkholderia pseudomallei TaxID=28450 RepID=UPI000CDD6CFB|nr:hypothetical protein [Burkholderia pseudomallei]MCD4517254.1 hypothetical protein [Burkholderia pseudomallei]CAJ2828687.1 Uncharacterised protein [Burkholderia pseudomallei]CAJ3125512.1 Uncharacterised protein [Burkholderia pseudomallei]CAJ4640549.1 Uncharacterised protein [Burkholderia pseudomallei]CAJ5047361.1 Uncharacterised protein [Burkholderia pseudomallei]